MRGKWCKAVSYLQQAVCVRRKERKKKREIPPHPKHHQIHSSPATATTLRRRATKHIPNVSPYSPASIDHGFVEFGHVRIQLSQSEKFTNVTHTQTYRQTDLIMAPCTHPGAKRVFGLGKYDLGRFSPSGLLLYNGNQSVWIWWVKNNPVNFSVPALQNQGVKAWRGWNAHVSFWNQLVENYTDVYSQDSPSVKVRVAQEGVGFLKHEKHHSLQRLSQRAAGDTQHLFFQTLLFCIFPLVRKKREIIFPDYYLDVAVFTQKNITTESESPWGLRKGIVFSTNAINWREYGLRYGSGRLFCSSLFAIIVCAILEKTAANASSHSY